MELIPIFLIVFAAGVITGDRLRERHVARLERLVRFQSRLLVQAKVQGHAPTDSIPTPKENE